MSPTSVLHLLETDEVMYAEILRIRHGIIGVLSTVMESHHCLWTQALMNLLFTFSSPLTHLIVKTFSLVLLRMSHQIPPYDNARGRKCSYFQLETPSVDGRKQEDVVESDTQDANSSGDEERRIVLKDVPEPRGLPTWSTYFGPRVIV